MNRSGAGILLTRVSAALAMTVVLWACSSAPPPERHPFKFISGVTTQNDIVGTYGNPDCLQTKSDGSKIFSYMFVRPRDGVPYLTVKDYVPGMALYSNGTLTMQFLTIDFEINADGKAVGESNKTALSISQPDCE